MSTSLPFSFKIQCFNLILIPCPLILTPILFRDCYNDARNFRKEGVFMLKHSASLLIVKLHWLINRCPALFFFASQLLLGFLMVAGVSVFALAGGGLIWCIMALAGF